MRNIKIKKNKRVKIKREVKEFVLKFQENVKRQLTLLKKMDVNINEVFPKIFCNKEMSFEAIYSIDKEHILIRMISSDKFEYKFNLVNGDVIDYFDESGTWSRGPVAFKIQDCFGVNLKNINIIGGKPFSLDGEIFITLDGMEFSLPNDKRITLEYASIMSYKIFLEKLRNIDIFVDNIIFTYFDYFKTYNEKLNLSEDTKIEEYKNQLKIVGDKFLKLIHDTNTKELEIDSFIEKNPIILEKGLDIITPIHQVVLTDIFEEYGQDLKPDVIGFNKYTNGWSIIDYKRAKRSLIKNNGKVRCAFKSEVNDLEAQLRDYREYFNDSTKRKEFYNKYKVDVEYPDTIGIIGLIDEIEEKQFNRLILDKPKWFNVRTYNYLEKKFKDYIQDSISLS
ncbi:protein of unknown function [Clostridium collagenovorans DSM 3089]|uniref:Shedu protein SduA C-terminal domain-containing protein n=1 Tax=Clostridium collagenovorans DSM 3089 TaxID=1121306 RepID=A0A1M5XN80_9CLOT|nr:Shedu anti-phage system protein SduA domain-containing protein [Clostridium collagenovorans]SHI01112.1 protein of unknown function [Clostridium collagenovorans DSM 3089]